MNLVAPSAIPVTLTEIDGGRSITVVRGTDIRVTLKAVSGTGYIWQIAQNDPTVLKPLGLGSFEIQKGAPPGASGVQSFHFAAASSGRSELKMVYARPWERGRAPARSWDVTIRVTQ